MSIGCKHNHQISINMTDNSIICQWLNWKSCLTNVYKVPMGRFSKYLPLFFVRIMLHCNRCCYLRESADSIWSCCDESAVLNRISREKHFSFFDESNCEFQMEYFFPFQIKNFVSFGIFSILDDFFLMNFLDDFFKMVLLKWFHWKVFFFKKFFF